MDTPAARGDVLAHSRPDVLDIPTQHSLLQHARASGMDEQAVIALITDTTAPDGPLLLIRHEDLVATRPEWSPPATLVKPGELITQALERLTRLLERLCCPYLEIGRGTAAFTGSTPASLWGVMQHNFTLDARHSRPCSCSRGALHRWWNPQDPEPVTIAPATRAPLGGLVP